MPPRQGQPNPPRAGRRAGAAGVRVVGVLLALAAWASGGRAWGQDLAAEREAADRRCLRCHGQERIGTLGPAERLSMVGTWLDAEPRPAGEKTPDRALKGDEPATRPALYVRPGALTASVHASNKCIDCHADAARLPHEPVLKFRTCATACHQKEAEAFPKGAHSEALKRGDPLAPTCASCHGGHEILRIGDSKSPQHRLNSIFLCAQCHERHSKATPGGYKPKLHIEAYLHSAHGKAVAQSGLVAAPTCSDCHGAHAVHAVADAESPVNRANVYRTCGACHVGILNIYQKSLHGTLAAKGDAKAPVCTDCHSSHEIIQPDRVAFKLASGDRCGRCHEDRIEHYRETFHGKALELGLPKVAACYDCHGHHDIVPIKDPQSRLHGERKLETCRQCHPNATENFTGYIAHADHMNRRDYPVLYWTFIVMTMIVVGTFLFFGAHTVLWLLRTAVVYIRDRRAFVEAKKACLTDTETFTRFKPFDRFLHVLVMTSFLTLVATGMPLKFYYTAWAKELVRWMGGLEAAGQFHRLAAVVTFLYFVLHIGSLAQRGWVNRSQFMDENGRFSVRRSLGFVFGPDLPYPHIQDVKDWWAHQKWFFGRGPRPQFDRWTYWEKFDYMAVFWGVAVIGLSGLVMWFPETCTRVLPGWIINVALIVHSDEALLAAGFIFAFHFFNVHFRPEKFPIDSVIFSGRISKTEMLHERRRWYDRLLAAGTLESIKSKGDEWTQWRRVVHPLGFLAFGLGLVLLVLIIYAMSSRLIGGP